MPREGNLMKGTSGREPHDRLEHLQTLSPLPLKLKTLLIVRGKEPQPDGKVLQLAQHDHAAGIMVRAPSMRALLRYPGEGRGGATASTSAAPAPRPPPPAESLISRLVRI